jgi:hypothetical protein
LFYLFLVMKKKQNTKKQVNVEFDPVQLRQLDGYGKARGLKRASAIRMIVLEKLAASAERAA